MDNNNLTIYRKLFLNSNFIKNVLLKCIIISKSVIFWLWNTHNTAGIIKYSYSTHHSQKKKPNKLCKLLKKPYYLKE